MIRTFLAFELPPLIRKKVAIYKESIKNYSYHKIKWVEDENLHITLQFIGDVNENHIADLSQIFKEIYNPVKEIEFKYKTHKLVPGRNPHIIWLEFEPESKEIYKTSHKLRTFLFEKGYKLDKKPLKFHITLGRIKKELNSTEIDNILHSSMVLPAFTVKEVTFFKSTLTPNGAIYNIIDKYKLKI